MRPIDPTPPKTTKAFDASLPYVSRRPLLLAVALAAALSVGCSGDSDLLPTASDPSGQTNAQLGQFDALSSSAPSWAQNVPVRPLVCNELERRPDPNLPERGLECRVFEFVRLSAEQIEPGKARVRYSFLYKEDYLRRYKSLRGDDLAAFFVVRFWSQGRHLGVPQDFVIGLVRPGNRPLAGEFVAEVPMVSRDAVVSYNIDLDFFGNEDYYRRGDTSCEDQCDRGGQMRLTPPREQLCQCQGFDDPAEDRRQEDTVCEGDPRFDAPPPNFFVTAGACATQQG